MVAAAVPGVVLLPWKFGHPADAGCGRGADRESDLHALAVRQAQWFMGCNPFAASLVYGAGRDSSEPYAIFPGKTVGAVSVGIQTKGNTDEPIGRILSALPTKKFG